MLIKKDKMIGLFGQSGAGKTSIIKNLPDEFNKIPLVKNIGIIRKLFQNNPDKYSNPEGLLKEFKQQIKDYEVTFIFQEIAFKYIKSQLNLLNDFSAECYSNYRELRTIPSIILFDRSPVDFYILTLCGLEFIMDNLNIKGDLKANLNNQNLTFLDFIRDTSIHNTNLMFDTIITVLPWSDSMNELQDGVRDQYLASKYTGDNWYYKANNIVFNNTKQFCIPEHITALDARSNYAINAVI